MNPSKFSIDVVNTSYGKQYNIVDKDGTVYATTYDKQCADIIHKAIAIYY